MWQKKEKNTARTYGIEGWEEVGVEKQESGIKSAYFYSLPNDVVMSLPLCRDK